MGDERAVIRVKLTETVEYRGEFTRDDVVNMMARLPDGSTDPDIAADYAAMPDESLAAEFLTELNNFAGTSDAVYDTIERNNEVVGNQWDLR
ncbi:hypothetical protein [Mycobacterium avium]|uniref:hypothetical protein n=1 Tax=Mycobacterium avium TaxID=1764 RepID=UPI00111C83E2|nr:hypothetical protein [Mycobacterium avium]